MSDPPRYTTDTHPLVWHLRRSRRLSAKAQACFQAADLGQAQIIIPTMVLVEVMYLAEHNRITTQLNEVLTLVRTSTNYLADHRRTARSFDRGDGQSFEPASNHQGRDLAEYTGARDELVKPPPACSLSAA